MDDETSTVPPEPRPSAAPGVSSRPREVEGTLLVSAESPSSIQRQLATLRSIGRYTLLPEEPRRIQDVYLDIIDRLLERQRIGLRLRSSKDSVLLTLKTDSRNTDTASDRMEIEVAWSRDALVDVLGQLAQCGISVPSPPDAIEDREALAVLAELGFEPVQARDLLRVPRSVVLSTRSTEPLAEMAIDAVTYRFHDTSVRLYEVEVETKGHGGLEIVEEITTALLAAFPTDLRRWRHGKFPTGIALRDLLSSGDLAGLLDSSGLLYQSAYEVVNDALDGGYRPGVG